MKLIKKFIDFKQIEKVVLTLNSCFLRLNGKWNGELEIVFNSYKAALQMEKIEFQEDLILKKKLMYF